ncbi:MAG: anthranilate synthase component I [Kiritimatiellaeota bacterium]|nr:anthranilate synthase component I [Kiritimatiellota bacterium]
MSYYPDLPTFMQRAAQGNLVPVWRELMADQETPVSAYERVRAALRQQDHASHTFLLESVEGGEHVGRYSFIGGTPRAILRAWGRRVEITTSAGVEVLADRDPLDALKQHMARFRPVRDPRLPRFIGGAVGFLGYDCIAQFEPRVPLAPPGNLRAPDMVFMVTDTLIIFDRVRHTLQVIANALVEDDPATAYRHACARIDSLVAALETPIRQILLDAHPPMTARTPRSNISRAQYVAAVGKAQEYIRAGDIIQTVLAQRFEVDCTEDSLDVYRALRSVNPSPYMFLLDLSGSALVGSSPEIHARCEEGRVETRPIAGTRPRHEQPAEDQRLEQELLADPKERAEHIMLVDLARNDLGRVCRYGTVRVPELMAVERYSHVMHIVSDVTGELAPGYDAYDLLRATFPAGTLSGAPKIRAMEIIAELEPVRRGPYGGAVGYFSFDGNLDSCITIRTIVMDEGKAYVQAGAGIVADSDPQREYEETQNKARGMFIALELARRFAAARKQMTMDDKCYDSRNR